VTISQRDSNAREDGISLSLSITLREDGRLNTKIFAKISTRNEQSSILKSAANGYGREQDTFKGTVSAIRSNRPVWLSESNGKSACHDTTKEQQWREERFWWPRAQQTCLRINHTTKVNSKTKQYKRQSCSHNNSVSQRTRSLGMLFKGQCACAPGAAAYCTKSW
jgi:hypothetical protein